MKYILIAILFALSLNVNAQNYKQHKVKKGETIETIARLYLVTPFDIYALNPDAKNKLKPDTILIIPSSKVKNEPLDEEIKEIIGFKSHKVKRKETLYSLSKKYNISIDEIKKHNPVLYAENLKKGDRIKIPRYKTIINKQTLNNTLKKYVVQPSEGKWRIAYKFGITVPELEALNPNMNEVIQPGDELNVPNIADNEEKPVEETYGYYQVLPKEGWYRLNKKLGLTQEQLETLNPELKDLGLRAGMVLKIPADVDLTGLSEETGITNLEFRMRNMATKKLAILLPFQLNRIDLDSIEESKDMIKNNALLSAALDFHSGVLMALDSAKRLGISTNLKVFDTENRTSRIANIVDKNDFGSYDAVIGPLVTKNFDRFSAALKNERVPILAPLSKPDNVYEHVYQTIPDTELLSKKMMDFIKADSTKVNVVIIADQAHKNVSDKLKSEFPKAKQIYSRSNKEKTADAYFLYPKELDNVFRPGRNIVFLETDNKAFASSVISMLNGLNVRKTEIILTTLDKNKAFEGENIDNYHLSNLKFHYASVNKSYDDEKPSTFVKDYVAKYKVTPNKYAVRGFDLTLDILLRLASEDNLYQASGNDIQTEYIENKFRYSKKLFGGYINEAVYIVKYDNLQIVKAN